MQSTISRFACRIICERNPPFTARIYAAGFDSSKNIFLGVKSFFPEWCIIFNHFCFQIPKNWKLTIFIATRRRLPNGRHQMGRWMVWQLMAFLLCIHAMGSQKTPSLEYGEKYQCVEMYSACGKPDQPSREEKWQVLRCSFLLTSTKHIGCVGLNALHSSKNLNRLLTQST